MSATADLQVWMPGTEVEVSVNNQPFDALVVEVSIQFGRHVAYRVTWFDGRVRQCEWLEACEVRGKGKRGTVGFIPDDA
jgi:hypothetical protein